MSRPKRNSAGAVALPAIEPEANRPLGGRGLPAGGVFITGTDTAVGKTVVSAALALALRGRGVGVGVMKPAESGCSRVGGRVVPEDALFLKKAAECEAALELVNPYALEQPLAPALAAEREGVTIAWERIEPAYRALAASHDLVLVEGAGGLLVPLEEELRMMDVARALHLPVLVVARNALGAINHTALTVRVARSAGLRVLGVVLNNPAPPRDPAGHSNRDSLARWGGAPMLGEVPYLPCPDHRSLLRAVPDGLVEAALPMVVRGGRRQGTC